VVVEHKDAGVSLVPLSRAAHVARTQVAVWRIRGGRQRAGRFAHPLTLPGPLVAVGRHDDPLTPQRMPTLLPDHARCTPPLQRRAPSWMRVVADASASPS